MPDVQDRQRRNVLIVEDEVLVRLAVAEGLRARGYTVIEAASGEEARSLVLAGVVIDAVLSDIRMPGEMDGAGLADWLNEYGLAAPIILTSGLPLELAQARTRCPHVKAFVAKPYDHAAVIARIEELIAARD